MFMMVLRLSWRGLRRRIVGITAIILAVAAAVAVNAALFSVVDGLLFRPLPFWDPDRLVTVGFRDAAGGLAPLAYQPNLAYRRRELREALSQSVLVAAVAQAGSAVFFRQDSAVDAGLQVAGVDAKFFALLGLTPVLGSAFTRDDERSSATASAQSIDPLPIVIGYELWQTRFAGSHSVLGLHDLADRRVRIVGVMGSGVKFPGETNVWAPVPSDRARPPTYARLAPGATVEQLSGLFRELTFTALETSMRPEDTRALPVLFAAAVLLLVVTWVQVTALTFGGSLGQMREVGILLALGAGRRHVVAQAAVDAVVTAGAAFGLAWLAVGPLVGFVVSMLPEALSHGRYLEPDFRTLIFGCSVSLLALIVLSAAPLAIFGRAAPLALLHGHLLRAPLRADRLRRGLLIAQMTLTVALLYLTGLAFHSFVQAMRFDYGFDSEHVLVFTPPPWAQPNTTAPQALADFEEHQRKVQAAVRRLQQAPGVIGAAVFGTAPLSVGRTQDELQPVQGFGGRRLSDVRVHFNAMGVDFVQAFGAELVAGQSFDAEVHAGRDDVVVINESLARQLAPSFEVGGGSVAMNVLGRELQWEGWQAEVIGVIRDFVDVRPDVPSDPQVFMPTRRSSTAVAIRVAASVELAMPAVRGLLEQEWGPLPPRQFRLMRDELGRVLVPYRGQSILLGLIAACCLPIAVVGLIGTMTHSVRARRREIAVRVAVGADPNVVRRSVHYQAVGLAAIGIVLGTGIGAAAGALIAHELFQVQPADLWTSVTVAALMLAIAWIAAAVPALQASRIEPAVVLRQG